MDRRTTPANPRVAASHLRGVIERPAYSDGHVATVCRPVLDILDIPGGRRDRQILCGTQVTVYEDRDGWSFIQTRQSGYCGYVLSRFLTRDWTPTHRVVSRSTHAYKSADLKSPDQYLLPFLSALAVIETEAGFVRTPLGYVPASHLEPLDIARPDLVTTAEYLLDTPYLWGGNSTCGIDCSGLVEACFTAANLPCPGDSDLQEASIGTALDTDTTVRRGDLLFWKGHVAIVRDATSIIHANARDMAVKVEGLQAAIDRIGPVRTHRRA